jgi:ankyrin repeat protein
MVGLHRAAMDDNLERARELLDQGHDVNGRNNLENTPLHDTAMLGNVDMVRLPAAVTKEH